MCWMKTVWIHTHTSTHTQTEGDRQATDTTTIIWLSFLVHPTMETRWDGHAMTLFVNQMQSMLQMNESVITSPCFCISQACKIDHGSFFFPKYVRVRMCDSKCWRVCVCVCAHVCTCKNLTAGVELHAGYGFVMSWEVSHHSLSVRVFTHQDLQFIQRHATGPSPRRHTHKHTLTQRKSKPILTMRTLNQTGTFPAAPGFLSPLWFGSNITL